MSELQDRQAAQALLRGINTMQMQAGLMPGGMASVTAPALSPMARPPHPADASTEISVRFQQQQLVAQLTMPQIPFRGVTPVARPGSLHHQEFPFVNYPRSQFGYGQGLAQQQAISSTNRSIAESQALMGLGARAVGTFGIGGGIGAAGGALLGSPFGPGGMLVGGALGGLAGAATFEHLGLGQTAQNLGSHLMTPMINARMRQLELQQMSRSFVRSGGDLSISGSGLSASASARLGQNLMNMADSRQFQDSTSGMFNRADVMKITRLASQFGMLDQSRTADEITQSVGKISRALSNFMKLAEEPDVIEAMRMMSNMRNLGLNLGETNVAVRNARNFARMAGTDMRGIMEAGMQGAGMFQAVGMSGGAGLNAGMAATGMAAQMASMMSPARLAMAGGREGIANTLTTGAARAGTLDAMLPMMLTRRNGELAIDQEALMDLAQGRVSIQDAMRRGSRRIQELGGRETLMELSTRRRELQDEAQRAMGGQLSALMPLIQARAIAAGTPGMTMGGALRTLGMDERQARTYEQMVQSPEFWDSLRQQQRQQRLEQNRDMAERMRRLEDQASVPIALRRAAEPLRNLARRAGTAYDEFIENEIGVGQDIDEAEAASGRRVTRVRRDRYRSGTLDAHRRDLARSGAFDANAAAVSAAVDRSVKEEEERSANLDAMTGNFMHAGRSPFHAAFAAGIAVVRPFAGPEGLGITRAQRGGEFVRDTIMSHEDILTRIRHGTGYAQATGQGRSAADIENRAREMQRMGELFDTSAARGAREQTRVRETARRGAGATMDDDRFDRLTARASVAINQYLESRVTSAGPFGALNTAPVSEAEMQAQVVEALVNAGATQEEAQQLARSPEFLRNASHVGSGSRSPQAQAAAERHIEAGGAVAGARTAQSAAHARREADARSEGVLRRLGADRRTAGSTVSERTAVLGLVSGREDSAAVRARREYLAIKALEARGATDPAAAERAAELRSRFNRSGRFSAAVRDAAMAEVDGTEIDQDVLAGMGGQLAGVKDIDAYLRSVTQDANTALSYRHEAGARELLGNDAGRAFQSRGLAGLREHLNRGGSVTGLSEEQIRRIREGDESVEEEVNRAITNAGDTGPSLFSFDGATRAAQRAMEGDFGAIIDGLQAFATRGGQAPTDERPTTPQTFEEAVGTFSDASNKLLQAAESMNQGGALSSVSGVMTTALTGFMPPLPGVLGILPQLAGGIFGRRGGQ